MAGSWLSRPASAHTHTHLRPGREAGQLDDAGALLLLLLGPSLRRAHLQPAADGRGQHSRRPLQGHAHHFAIKLAHLRRWADKHARE